MFHRSVNDPLAYDMVINESGRSLDAMVTIATLVAEEKIERLRAAQCA
jgi:hypothetical protein